MHGLFSSFIEELIRSQREPTLWADSATGSSMVTYDDVYVALCGDDCLLRESSGKTMRATHSAILHSTKVNAVPPSGYRSFAKIIYFVPFDSLAFESGVVSGNDCSLGHFGYCHS